MALSIGFSMIIYRISYRELLQSFPSGRIIDKLLIPSDFDFDDYRQERLAESERSLRLNLVLLNVGTLALGTMLSYELARRTLRPLEEAFEAQGRFTADASHELRTPLTAMQTSIEVSLRNRRLTLEQAKTLLEDTLDEVQKLSSLSNGLLKLTRNNQQRIPKQPTSLKQAADDAVAQLEHAAKAKQIAIQNNIGDLTVMGDDVSLKELLVILLDNAIKYSRQKTKVVLASQQHGRHAFLSVTDEGPGMKAIDIEHIFDRFYRADHSRSRGSHIEGYGLGLSIARQIAEAHEGTIEVKSKPGEGSTFTVRLPLA
jgi:signal transduction histidine kinase